MRLSAAFAPFALIAITISSCVAVHAQFQEPTREELQMTADAKAPGAPYVFLYLEDVTDQPGKTRTFYERIKILTDKGKEAATVHIPYVHGYEKLPEVEARTIHADGTVVPMTDKPSDLVDVKTKEFQVDTLVFTLPSAEVGSILEYRLKEKFSDEADAPTWMIQQSQLVHQAHYAFKNAGGLGVSWVSRVATDDKVQKEKNGLFTLDMKDIPPLPDEDSMPPLNTLKWRVSFFYTQYSTGKEFWNAVVKRWGEAMEDILKPDKTFKKAAEDLVSPGDTQTQKARKIYAAMMKLENLDYVPEKTKAERKKEKIKDLNTLDDVWKQQRGSSDDIALVFIAISRAAGLDVSPMKVVDRSRALYDEGFLSAGQFDDYIAVAELDGKEIYLDPGEKMCPFGLLHWRHSVSTGMRLKDKVASISYTPSGNYKSTAIVRTAELTVSSSGDLQGQIRIVLNGQEALHWRQLMLKNDESEVKKQFSEWLKEFLPEGVQGDFDHFVGMEDYESNLMATAKVTGTLGTATGKRFFLPGLFFRVGAKHPFATQQERKVAIDVHFPCVVSDDVTFHLPTGFTVESGPQTGTVNWEKFAQFKITTTAQADSINVVRTLAYGFTILGAKDYAELHDFYQKVATADQQQVVLTRATKAMAN